MKKGSSSIARWPSELYQLLVIGLPVAGAHVAWMGMGVMDTVMAGRLGVVDLAGIALGGSLMWPILLLFWGTLIAVTPTVSQLRGEGRTEAIGEVLQQAVWIVAASSVILIILFHNLEPVLVLTQASPEVVDIASRYLSATAWGMPGILMYFALRYMVEGLGRTRPAFVVAVTALICKFPLNYIFMYGELGMPALGGVGCGVASAIVMWFECLFMIAIALQPSIRRTGWNALSKFRFRWTRIREIVSLGLPIGLTSFLEMGFFSLVTLLLGRLGATVVSSHSIAMNIAGVAFMIPLALGQAASIRISFLVGGQQLLTARLISRLVLVLAPAVGLFNGGLIILFREDFAGFYTTNPEVIELMTGLLVFVGLFQLFDVIQAMVTGALRGYKATRFPLVANFAVYWLLTLPLGYFLAYGLASAMGIYGFWVAITCGLALVSVLVSGRLWVLANRGVEKDRSLGTKAA